MTSSRKVRSSSDKSVALEYKAVKLPEYGNVPRWLVLQQEIDSRLYILGEMLKDIKPKSPIEILVDDATGYEDKLTADALTLIAETRWLKREFDKLQRLGLPPTIGRKQRLPASKPKATPTRDKGDTE